MIRLTTILAIILVASQTVVAQESGTFRAIRSGQHEYSTIEHAEHTYTGGLLSMTGTIIESSGRPFLEGSSMSTECLAFSSISAAGVSIEAPCTDTYQSGDRVYTYAKRREGDLSAGSGGAGRREMLGGTGSYKGITGSCIYRIEYLEDRKVEADTECSWSRTGD